MKQNIIYSILLFCAFLGFTATAQQSSGKETIAVYHFTSSYGHSYDYALGVGNAIEAGILRSNRFTVVERTRFGAIKEEDKFKEANTAEIVNRASKLGAKTLVTGHIIGISYGDLLNSSGVPNGREYIEISVSFKIIDVATSEIKKSETIRGRGEGKNRAEAVQNAYASLDKLGRAHIGDYLPQIFKYMSSVTIENRKKGDFLKTFKIWGGSKDGLSVGDVVVINQISYLTNPNTGKKVEEKKMLGMAKIDEVNGESTATCTILNWQKNGNVILQLLNNNPESISLEYKGQYYEYKSLWDMLGN